MKSGEYLDEINTKAVKASAESGINYQEKSISIVCCEAESSGQKRIMFLLFIGDFVTNLLTTKLLSFEMSFHRSEISMCEEMFDCSVTCDNKPLKQYAKICSLNSERNWTSSSLQTQSAI